ncbi:glycopeptide antibiotics resistance protein [Bacillus tianshenii]|uniref:Glycopeptide antibiotics resistance protein n=1 Tax=Sutcliffiella tianshenii TaxID=1463404 RepID=A0ABS2NZJ0_9BACI|nr:VanZ family protein [Bacillus tianshenii]MBM7619783.1 glycopeptide antibiotics resistance protein [Bacillus tianshenii]
MNVYLKISLSLIFAIFFFILMQLVLFKFFYIGNIKDHFNFTYDSYYWNTHNFIPFHTFFSYLFYSNDLHLNIRLQNVGGNLVGFIPFGFILPLLFTKFMSTLKIGMATFFLSLFFEVSQLLFKLGSFDVDDIFLNTLGGIIGFFAVKFALKLLQSIKRARLQVITKNQ